MRVALGMDAYIGVEQRLKPIEHGLQLMCAGLSSVAVFGAEEEIDLAYKAVEGLEGALSLSRFEGSIVWQPRWATMRLLITTSSPP